MLKTLKTVAIILLLAAVVALIYFLPKMSEQTAPPVKEPPCEELGWMRDAPQARCVEYWKLQDKLEEA